MSKIKILFVLLFLNCFCLSFSQAAKKRNDMIVFLDLKSKALREYTIDKDTTSVHFSIYIKKYQYKKDRDKAIKIYNHRVKNIRTSGENPSDVRLPDFSIGFYVYSRKPERLKSLKGMKLMTIRQFQDSIYYASNPTYIIHQLKDGTYLKWDTYPMEIVD